MTELPERPEEVQTFMDGPQFGADAPDRELPPRGAAVMVVRSLRLPVQLDQRVKAAAEKRGVPTSTLSGSGSSWS
jgi:hypothetical protein